MMINTTAVNKVHRKQLPNCENKSASVFQTLYEKRSEDFCFCTKAHIISDRSIRTLITIPGGNPIVEFKGAESSATVTKIPFFSSKPRACRLCPRNVVQSLPRKTFPRFPVASARLEEPLKWENFRFPVPIP